MELISREEAIKCLDGNVLITEQKEAEAVKEYFEMVIARLKALPTVEERNVGEWLDNGDRYYRCSLCGMKDTDNWKFCRGCGAYMKGE